MKEKSNDKNDKKGFWNKIKAGVAVLMASLTIAIPTIKYAKDKNTNALNEGNGIEDENKSLNNDNGITENPDGTLTVDRNEFLESLKVDFPDEGEKVYEGLTYEQLSMQLEDVINKKNFSNKENEYIMELFDSVYENYDKWRVLNKDWPSKEKFISQNIIETLEVCTLELIDENSEKGQEMLDNGSAYGFTDEEDLKVTLIYNDEDKNDSIKTLMHELAHIRQMNLILNTDKMFKDYPDLSYVIIEGGATSKQVTDPPRVEKMSSNFLASGNIQIEYKMDDGLGYAMEVNFYNHLQYLAGYDVMEGVLQGNPVRNLEDKIGEKYGKENAKEILELIRGIEVKTLEKDHEGAFNYALKLENIFLDCLDQDISNLKTKKEIEQFTNVYRGYMINMLPKVYKDTFTDITDSYFPQIDELNNKMADKIYESGAFGFKSRTAADTLVYTSIDDIDEGFDWIYIPMLKDTKFKENEDGSITYYYENRASDEESCKYVCANIKKDRNDNKAQIKILGENEPEGLKPFYDDIDKGIDR